ncbi:XRE family transcriptional regulator [Bradyrhizobium retamae]|nr:S24 family peptidase [Bradyrhizobium retamae]
MAAKKAEAKKTHPKLEIIKTRVEERVTAANLSRNEASRRAGLGLSYVNDLLGDKSLNPTRESLAKLGAVLNTDVGYFFGEQETPRVAGSGDSGGRADNNMAVPETVTLYQIGLTDPDGFFSLSESNKTQRSPFIVSGPDAYFVSVPDDTMSPRYRAGEAVIVNPRVPVRHGGFAIVCASDNRVAIREVVSISTDKISVRSLSDQVVVEMPRASVKSLHRIMGSCELV